MRSYRKRLQNLSARICHKNKVAALQRELNKYLKKGHTTIYVNRNGVKTKV